MPVRKLCRNRLALLRITTNANSDVAASIGHRPREAWLSRWRLCMVPITGTRGMATCHGTSPLRLQRSTRATQTHGTADSNNPDTRAA